jgi:2-polyprenyl-3-methyl-5-hydroxy-6-metoxy-1,4-benzoquinol methylase
MENDRSFQFTARRDQLDGAGLSVECGPHLLHAAAGLQPDDVFFYPEPKAASRAADAVVNVVVRLSLPLLAKLADIAPDREPVWIRSTNSIFPLAIFDASEIPHNFVTCRYIDYMSDKVGRNHWWTSAVFARDGLMHIHGWAIPPKAWKGGLPKVFVDGKPAQSIAPAVVDWARNAYWFLSGRVQTGFYAVAPYSANEIYSKIEIDFGVSDRREGIRRFPVYQLNAPVESLKLPIPPDQNIHRVSGPGANRYSYLNGGKSDFERFRMLIAEKAGRKTLAGLDVLDWGIGCGRLARHFLEAGSKVTGIDIDADNINWCKRNLGAGTYVPVNLMPPTPLEASGFDVIISSSVLSHLTEPVMRSWLNEISRLLRPDGVALLSFNGDGNSYFYGSVYPAAIAALDGSGFFDEWKTPDLEGYIDDSEYYRLTLMSSARAQQIFSDTMEFQEFVLGVTSGHQDIAVLRKKS